jgi:hypothetical protein
LELIALEDEGGRGARSSDAGLHLYDPVDALGFTRGKASVEQYFVECHSKQLFLLGMSGDRFQVIHYILQSRYNPCILMHGFHRAISLDVFLPANQCSNYLLVGFGILWHRTLLIYDPGAGLQAEVPVVEFFAHLTFQVFGCTRNDAWILAEAAAKFGINKI